MSFRTDSEGKRPDGSERKRANDGLEKRQDPAASPPRGKTPSHPPPERPAPPPSPPPSEKSSQSKP